jgi:hypothetical protein
VSPPPRPFQVGGDIVRAQPTLDLNERLDSFREIIVFTIIVKEGIAAQATLINDIGANGFDTLQVSQECAIGQGTSRPQIAPVRLLDGVVITATDKQVRKQA